MYLPTIPMTDIACLRCLSIAVNSSMPVECAQRISASDWEVQRRYQDRIPMCVDCQASERMVTSQYAPDFEAARRAVAASRRVEYHYLGTSELARVGLICPGGQDDRTEQLTWLSLVPILQMRIH
jgi:hypothetical protein